MSTENNDTQNHDIQSHHVAWKDKLNLTNKIWSEAISECRMTYGTEQYRQSVIGLYNLIINIKKGPALYDMITKYKNDVWEKKIKDELERWRHENPDLRDELSIIQDEEAKIKDDLLPEFFHYIIQLLENSGFGTYLAEYEGEYEKM
jgi:hypothetical protein